MKLEIELDQECLQQIRLDNWLAEDMSDDEIREHVQELFTQMSTVKGLALVLENMDYFNY